MGAVAHNIKKIYKLLPVNNLKIFMAQFMTKKGRSMVNFEVRTSKKKFKLPLLYALVVKMGQ